ncbi:MAG: serine/threonine-protein kinase [Polyangiaceae bacterium]|jgi:serine/threonine-protein kinase
MSVTEGTMARARNRVGSMVKDKWQLEALLGAGGTACVYSAVHRNGRRVAIKVLHPEMSAIPDVVKRFLREGYLANRVGHPNAVAVMDDDRTDDGAVFLVMELLEGHSLERHAKTGGERLARSTVLRLMDGTLDVLAAAHAKGIVHRDIKPANLFMTVDGQIKVLDFGIARLVETVGDGPMTHTGFAIGTPSFMPPEQARGRWDLVDARTDVWAVGATMYALLTGDRPRHGATTTQEELLLAMTQPLAPLASILPDIAPEVAAIVDRAVAYDRDARWPDAMAMRQALSGLLGNASLVDSRARLPASPIAPVRGATDGVTVAVPDGALTTGRPFSSQSLPLAPTPSRTARTAFVGVAVLATLLVTVALVLAVARRPHHAPAGLAVSPPPPPITAIPSPPVAPTPPATSTATASAASEPSASSSAASPASASAHPASKPAPLAPRGPAANPFDQRF